VHVVDQIWIRRGVARAAAPLLACCSLACVDGASIERDVTPASGGEATPARGAEPRPTAAASRSRTAVVVELFSSEGCSSCPPADENLAYLAREQPVDGVEILPLELHVDYWNRLGWADPFSSPAFTDRQQRYARAFGQRGTYTPQMVVDGAREFAGAKTAKAKEAIAAAALAPGRATVTIDRAANGVRVSVAGASAEADVLVAVTESGLATDVPRGENAGSHLAHAPVVRDLERIGAVSGGGFTASFSPKLEATWRRENLRVVAFVQRRGDLRVTGAAATTLE
jgi:hypothetical protein